MRKEIKLACPIPLRKKKGTGAKGTAQRHDTTKENPGFCFSMKDERLIQIVALHWTQK